MNTKHAILAQDFLSRQWMYRILRHDGTVLVPMQYGPLDRAECIAQIFARFGGMPVLYKGEVIA